jgi:hypothetical protein
LKADAVSLAATVREERKRAKEETVSSDVSGIDRSGMEGHMRAIRAGWKGRKFEGGENQGT